MNTRPVVSQTSSPTATIRRKLGEDQGRVFSASAILVAMTASAVEVARAAIDSTQITLGPVAFGFSRPFLWLSW